MKLSEFKETLTQRLEIFQASCLFAFHKEMAYAGNNWAAVFSTTAYTLSILLFLHIIFGNTKEIAGYSQNEMLFYFFVGQMTFYTNYYLSISNIRDLTTDVNRGNLDMILMKPVPALFFVTTRNIGGVRMFADGFPPTLAIILSINWPSLQINSVNLIYGIFIFLLGSISLHVFQFLAGLPVFWFGESEQIVDLAGFVGTGAGSSIPLEGYSHPLQFILSTFIPILIATAFSVSAILGKTNAQLLFFWALAVALVAIWVRRRAWNYAIKNYTSASS